MRAPDLLQAVLMNHSPDPWACQANASRSCIMPEQAALASIAAARRFAKADKHLCQVAEGLYIGQPLLLRHLWLCLSWLLG